MARLTSKRAGACADCGKAFPAGTAIRWFPKIGSLCREPCKPLARPGVDFPAHPDNAAPALAPGAPSRVSAPLTGAEWEAMRQRALAATPAAIPCGMCGHPTEPGTVACAPCHARTVALLSRGVSPSLLAHDDDGRIVRPDMLPPPDPTFAATIARRAVPRDAFAEFADGIAAARAMFAALSA